MPHQFVPAEIIDKRILLIRGQKVLLGPDLARLYEVPLKALMQAVKRNADRFPHDFAFQLTHQEFEILKSQYVTSSWGGVRKMPYAFTEQGVAMLSSVLRSKRAIRVNVEIMRAFVRLRELLATHKDLARKLEDLEKKYDKQFAVVFKAIRELMAPPEPQKRPIGFQVKERHATYSAQEALIRSQDALCPSFFPTVNFFPLCPNGRRYASLYSKPPSID